MTTDERAELRLLLAEATPVPWHVGAQNDHLFIIDRPPQPSNDDLRHDAPTLVIATMGECRVAPDAALIAAAVNALPGLLDAADADGARIQLEEAVLACDAFEERCRRCEACQDSLTVCTAHESEMAVLDRALANATAACRAAREAERKEKP